MMIHLLKLHGDHICNISIAVNLEYNWGEQGYFQKQPVKTSKYD